MVGVDARVTYREMGAQQPQAAVGEGEVGPESLPSSAHEYFGGASVKEKGLAASPAAGEKAFCVDQRHGRALFFIILGWRNTSLLSASPNRTVC